MFSHLRIFTEPTLLALKRQSIRPSTKAVSQPGWRLVSPPEQLRFQISFKWTQVLKAPCVKMIHSQGQATNNTISWNCHDCSCFEFYIDGEKNVVVCKGQMKLIIQNLIINKKYAWEKASLWWRYSSLNSPRLWLQTPVKAHFWAGRLHLTAWKW